MATTTPDKPAAATAAPGADELIELEERDDGSYTVHDPRPPEDDPGIVAPAVVDRPASDADHDDDDDALSGADAAAAGTDADRTALRERRRVERQQKKANQREREDSLRAQLDSERAARRELEQRMAVVERRSDGVDVQSLDRAIKTSTDAAGYYKGVIAEATTKQDGASVAEATEKMIMARSEAERLQRIKQAYGQRQQQPIAPDPALKQHAETWMASHRWYNPNGADADSRVTLTVDSLVQQDGFDPRTPAYWTELDRRLKIYLPHRSAGATDGGDEGGDGGDAGAGGGNDDNRGAAARGKPRAPVAGGGRDGGGAAQGAGAKKTFQLSKDRVDALKEAGMWDDPVARANAIREYHKFDRQNTGRS